MQALGGVAPTVALGDGHDQALLGGQQAVPERRQEREDVGRVRLHLELLAALKDAALFLEPLRKRPPEIWVKVDFFRGVDPHLWVGVPLAHRHEPHRHEGVLVDLALGHRGCLAQHIGSAAQRHLALLGGFLVVELAHVARVALLLRLENLVAPVDRQVPSASRGGAQNGDGHARVGQDFLVLVLALVTKHLDFATVAGQEARLVAAENEVRHQFSECGADAAAAAAHDRRVESLQLGV
mmetsp:Transcript_11014/g.25828  ORF Transcript_11014/g.25828 Transcript_11014/m.25828 type:complete len:239 (-) Transcript_11014:1010-1726(-)